MVFASILIACAKVAFLGQYYILLCLIILRNVWKRIFSFSLNRCGNIFSHPRHEVNQDVFSHTHDLVRHEQFTLDIYQCLTQDEAYVTLWRIRNGDALKSNGLNPILIQHGLLDCAMSWFLQEDKQKTLPYALAAEGYDVWVGNNRGTIHSDKNSHLPGYWDFNIDHFIQYDQPALINKVLEETNKEKLIYIGHSQGSTQFLLALAEHPELKFKIDKFFGMGTVISLSNLKQHRLIDTLSRFYLLEILQKIGFKTILNTPKWMKHMLGVLIHHFQFYVDFIITFISFLCGKTQKNNIDAKRLGILAAHEPGGTSVHSIKHWIQAYRYGKFRKYDYGKQQNIKKYGSITPPDYTFEHIKQLPFKTHIFRGSKDAVISDKDFQILIQYFDEESVQIHIVEDYAHLDYAWGVNAKEDIYDTIVEVLKNENGSLKTIQESLEKSCSYDTQDTSFLLNQGLMQMDF